MTHTEDNKRIAKNTLMLYIRMLATMAISLYTSRIVLNTLGIEDYGIYNVVGGLVTVFGFISGSMASATRRFLAFELGKNDFEQLKKTFSMSINVYLIIALIVFVLAETVGLWFVNTQLTLPDERMRAANWVYQFSLFAFIINIISSPYNAIITAHERMNIYAWISIIDVVLKLAIVFLLQIFGFDKLILYAILIFCVSVLMRMIYTMYCRKNFPESRYSLSWDKKLFQTLLSYAGWNLWGNSAAALFGQGINILLNIFFGPAINAARGIAYAVKSAVNNFVTNFQTAVNPQIIKSFAANDLAYMHQLIFRGAKFSYFLLFTLTLPILLETETILKLWLKIVPDYAVIFTRLVLIEVLINSISGPLMTAAQASGKIKLYQSVVGGLLLLIVPISYVVLKMGYPPQSTLYVSISMAVIALFARLKIISPLVTLNIKHFLKNVINRIIPVTLIALIPPIFIITNIEQSVLRFLLILIFASSSAIVASYFFGLTQNEKHYIINKLKPILSKYSK